MQSLIELPRCVKLEELPESARWLLTHDRDGKKPRYPGAGIEVLSEDTFVVRHRWGPLLVYCCHTCGDWIGVLADKVPRECNHCMFLRRRRRRYAITSSTAKERPLCRRTIIEHGLTPWPALDVWDGVTARTRDGERTSLTEGMRKQLRKMLVEGYFDRPNS